MEQIIEYKSENYSGVVLGTYLTEEGINELLDIFTRQIIGSYRPDGETISVDSKIEVIDDFHGKIVITIDKLIDLQFLLVPVSTEYLTLEDMVTMNEKAQTIFPEKGVYGKFGIVDSSTIDYTLKIVKYSEIMGLDTTPTVITKAAKYWWRTAHYQAFSNGNKRTGLLAALNFLSLNHLIMKDIDDLDELYEDVSMKIANKKMNEDEVRTFILKHVEYDLDECMEIYQRGIKYEKS